MDIFIGVIVGLLVLMFLVTAHEFGHFIMARRNGVRVLEFGLCFPPRVVAWVKDPKTKKWKRLPRKDWKKPQDGLIFSINLLPIGGFCQMDGESAEDSRKGTFGASSYWSKTKILFGGVAMNWLIAIIIFTILAWTGMPMFIENQFIMKEDVRTEGGLVSVVEVLEGSPAEKAGFKPGDIIETVNGEIVRYASDVTEINSRHAGEDVTYEVERTEPGCIEQPDCYMEPCPCQKEGDVTKTHIIEATLNEAGGEYLLGISMSSSQALSYSTWSAPLVGVGVTLQLTGETFKGLGIMLGNLVSGTARLFSFNSEVREEGQEALSEVRDSVSGPVGIIGVLFPAFTSAGPTNLAFLTALISVSLACMNVLPIPALDGGRWLLITIYKMRGKKLTKKTEEKIVARAFMVLLALIIIVTVFDVMRFF